MDDLHISLSDRQQAFVDAQVAEGDFPDASAYVAALIDAEAKAKAQAWLEAELLKGLEGDPIEWTEEEAAKLRRLASEAGDAQARAAQSRSIARS